MVAPRSPHRDIRRTYRSTNRQAIPETQFSRPPVIIEFGSLLVTAGYAGQVHPKQIVALPQLPNNVDESKIKFSSAATWYRYLSGLLQEVYSRLGQDPTERRAIVVLTVGNHAACGGLEYPLHNWQDALSVVLRNLGVPALRIIPAGLEMIPWIFPQISSMLTVTVSGSTSEHGYLKAEVLAFANGQNLPYTYQHFIQEQDQVGRDQSSYSDSKYLLEDPIASQLSLTDEQDKNLDKLDPHCCSPLVTMVLKCLEACPVDVRKAVISNMVVVTYGGTDPVSEGKCSHMAAGPELGRRLARQLQAVLKNNGKAEDSASKPPRSERRDQLSDRDQPKFDESGPEPGVSLTLVPPPLKRLELLAEHISLLDLPLLGRSDVFYTWLDTCVWACYWHGCDPDASQFQWVKLK